MGPTTVPPSSHCIVIVPKTPYLLSHFKIKYYLQNEIINIVGPKAFELGLLMGTESDPLEEKQTQVYCFHHLLIQQFMAAKYVASLDKVTDRDIQSELVN